MGVGKMLTFGVLAVAMSISPAVAKRNKVAFTIPVDESFSESGITWNAEYGLGYVFRIDFRERDGTVFVCGAGTYVNGFNSHLTKRALRDAKVTMNGKTILRNLTFFTNVKKGKSLIGAPANCVDTGAALSPKSNEFDIKYANKIYYD